jgi:Tol biopolymer transport system component
MKRASILIALFFLLPLSMGGIALQSGYDLFQKALVLERADGKLQEAIALYQKLVDASGDKSLSAKAQLHIGMCYEKLGLRDARRAYQKVIDNYPQEQEEVGAARARIAALASGTMSDSKPVFHKLNIQTFIWYGGQLSPDGQRLAYNNPYDGTLWNMPMRSDAGTYIPGAPVMIDTGGVKVETHGFAWSADGKWIAFNEKGNMSEKQFPGIYLVPVEGGKPKKVRDGVPRGGLVDFWDLSLTPDASTLAFTAQDGDQHHIYSIPVAGGIPKRLTDYPSKVGAYSPDGAWLAFTGECGPPQPPGGPRRSSRLCIMPTGGGAASMAADVDSSTPVWSPGGDMVAFIVGVKGSSGQIWIVPVSGRGMDAGEPAKIDAPQGVVELRRLLGWTPDNKIGFISASPSQMGLYTVPAAGGKASAVHIGSAVQPRWSPDGQRIFFRDGNGGIAFIPAAGGQASTVPIQSDTGFLIPGWGAGLGVSPDGSRIVFSGNRKGNGGRNIWTVSVKGGTPTRLTEIADPFMDLFPCWSPDGKSIAFVRLQKDDRYRIGYQSSIYAIPSEGGAAMPITGESDRVSSSSIAWSPDGTMLAYFSRDDQSVLVGESAPSLEGTLRVYSFPERRSRAVTKVTAPNANKELAWSPDSRRIAYNEEKKGIYVVSVDNGISEEIKTDLGNSVLNHLSWSPDGSRLVFIEQHGGGPELWLMEGFLPLVKR